MLICAQKQTIILRHHIPATYPIPTSYSLPCSAWQGYTSPLIAWNQWSPCHHRTEGQGTGSGDRSLILLLTPHFFSCHTLIIQFRRRKCKAEMRLFSIQTQFFYCWGAFFNQIGRGCVVSHPRPSCIIVSIAIAVRSPYVLHTYSYLALLFM